jgi:hypothetical protein
VLEQQRDGDKRRYEIIYLSVAQVGEWNEYGRVRRMERWIECYKSDALWAWKFAEVFASLTAASLR